MTDTSEAPITQDEMIAMFGESMPIEAVNLIWSTKGNKTVGELRAELREIAKKRAVREPDRTIGWLRAMARPAEYRPVDDPYLQAAAMLERMSNALERIKALKDGYRGGSDEYARGRKAGYDLCGNLAEEGLGL